MLDLGAWMKEHYRIPGRTGDPEALDATVAELEEAEDDSGDYQQ